MNNVKNLTRGGSKRDTLIDYLRTVGVFMIILAHVNATEEIQVIRRFDVVLLVFASGMSFSYSREITNFEEYRLYIWKRIKRLLFPAWAFVALYIIWLTILNLHGAQYNLSFRTIVSSFALINGVGYVWIIRIYLCMAVIAPFLKTFSNKIKSDGLYLAGSIVVSCSYSLIVYAEKLICQGTVKLLLETCILPIFGYGIVYFLGIRCRRINEKKDCC